MQKLKFINGKNEEINLNDLTNFGIVNWAGLSETDVEIQSQSVPFEDGSVFLDSIINDRGLNFTVAINDNGDLAKRYELRRSLISALNPKLGEGKLIYENDYLEKQIICVPKIPIIPNKNSNETGTLKVGISFTACNPYWEDIEESESSVTLAEKAIINNEGDVQAVVEIDVDTNSITNPIIENIDTKGKIELTGTFENGFIISTGLGNKGIVSKVEKINSVNIPTIRDMVYCDDLNLYVALCDSYNTSGSIFYSEDLVSWKMAYIDDTEVDERYYKIIYSKRRKMFYVGGGDRCYSSQDAKNWSQLQNLSQTSYKPFYSESLDKFGYVRGSNYIYVEGVSKYHNTDSTKRIFDCFYSEDNNLFVAYGANIIVTSNNGNTWTEIQNINFTIEDLKYVSNLGCYIALTNNGVMSSTDLSNWTLLSSRVLSNFSYCNWLNRIVAKDSNGFIYKSINGKEWVEIYNLEEFPTGLCYTANNTAFFSKFGKLIKTEDLENFEITEYNKFPRFKCVKYCSEPDMYVGVSVQQISTSGYDIKLFISKDAEVWEEKEIPQEIKSRFSNIYDICYSDLGNRKMYCFNVGSRIYYTSNFVDWTYKEISVGKIEGSAIINGITEDSEYLIVSQGNKLMNSIDGNTFIDCTMEPMQTYRLKKIKYQGNEIVVALGRKEVGGEYKWSIEVSDQSPFVFRSCSFYPNARSGYIKDIAYSEDLNIFVACGDNGLLYSYDLSEWFFISDSSGYYFSEVFYDKKRKVFIARQLYKNLWKSIDGKNFTRYSKLPMNVYSTETLETKNGELYFENYDYVFKFYYELGENIIDKLSEDSTLAFYLKIGENKIRLRSTQGDAVAKIKFKNKYIGV